MVNGKAPRGRLEPPHTHRACRHQQATRAQQLEEIASLRMARAIAAPIG
jgi:hypothetical protein